MSEKYILDGHEVRPAASLEEWAVMFNDADKRRVGEDHPAPGVTVSTVFLGLDHSFGGGPPLLFETMIFGGPHEDYQERYSTWDEAVAGHGRAVNLTKATGAE